MARLIQPGNPEVIETFDAVQAFLAERGITLQHWQASVSVPNEATEQQILNAYQTDLKPYMQANGYQSADVINVHCQSENIDQLRAKFLAEHTHMEDEVRFFVDGQGYFWFNLQSDNNLGEEVFCVHCQAGDLLSVPTGTKHWFDMGYPAFVKVIRIFSDHAGWRPDYTGSGIDQKFPPSLAYCL